MAGQHPPAGGELRPQVWATPRTSPPASVPQIDPSPPMTTASKAKISRVGPMLGVKVVRTPRNRPATATVARAMAVAMANTWRGSRPTRLAASGSSEVARNERPSRVRLSTSCRPTRTATAVTRVSSGNQPTASRSLTRMLAFSSRPASSPWESAENSSRSRFWRMIDSPRVTSTGGSGSPPRRAKLSRPRWSR